VLVELQGGAGFSGCQAVICIRAGWQKQSLRAWRLHLKDCLNVCGYGPQAIPGEVAHCPA